MSYTSDHFDALHKAAIDLIKRGKAYTDDTLQMQMREERMHGIASKRREDPIDVVLERFAEMCTGSEEGQKWCLRAKMSVDDPNKALRDPVIYRVNITPHHRTGLVVFSISYKILRCERSATWKAYPTYDFACPVVVSVAIPSVFSRVDGWLDRTRSKA